MKFRILSFILIAVIFISCARAVTPSEAASGRFKKCRAVR